MKDEAQDAAIAIRADVEASARRLQQGIDEIQDRAHRRVVSGVRQEVLGLSLVAAATAVGFLARILA